MMKKILSLLVCALIVTNSFGQNYETAIKTQALEMVRALVKKDFPGFLKYVHPKVIEASGGREKLIQRMDTANKIAAQFGAEIKKIILGDPGKVISCNKELQATLPQTSTMEALFGTVVLETTLIAISADGGQHWVFIDTSLYNSKDIKQSMPSICHDLVIPPMKKPVFTPKEN